MLELISNKHMTEAEFKTGLILFDYNLETPKFEGDLQWFIVRNNYEFINIFATGRVSVFRLVSARVNNVDSVNIHCIGYEALFREIRRVIERAEDYG